MKGKVFIRADGNSKIGLGHIVRSVALANMLKRLFSIIYYCKTPSGSIVDFIYANGFDIVRIDHEEAFFEDISGCEIVILDGYNFDENYQIRIKKTGATLICIDDLHNRHFVADVIINHAPGITKSHYQTEGYTRFLLGSEYALLRPSFHQQALINREIKNCNQALICFGGSDSRNLTVSALKVLLCYSQFKKVIVITGGAYPYLKELNNFISDISIVTHHHNIEEKKIVEDLLEVQLAIVPASGILFEVIACKTPAISGYYVDNQIDIYKGFLQRAAFYDAGNFEETKLKSAIEEALSSDPNTMIKNQSSCIDGKSSERYVEFFKTLSYDRPNSCG